MNERHRTLNAPRKTVKLAKQLRRDMSFPEVLLWRELRQRLGGYKFRRQHPIQDYIADFACVSVRLIIEIDGEAHDRDNRPERDAIRDARLAEQGYRTMRISARNVLEDLNAVIEGILACCGEERPLHQPPPSAMAGPPSRSGEDFL